MPKVQHWQQQPLLLAAPHPHLELQRRRPLAPKACCRWLQNLIGSRCLHSHWCWPTAAQSAAGPALQAAAAGSVAAGAQNGLLSGHAAAAWPHPADACRNEVRCGVAPAALAVRPAVRLLTAMPAALLSATKASVCCRVDGSHERDACRPYHPLCKPGCRWAMRRQAPPQALQKEGFSDECASLSGGLNFLLCAMTDAEAKLRTPKLLPPMHGMAWR